MKVAEIMANLEKNMAMKKEYLQAVHEVLVNRRGLQKTSRIRKGKNR